LLPPVVVEGSLNGSDEWVFGRVNEPVVVRDRRTGRRIAKLRVTDADGAPVARRLLPQEESRIDEAELTL